MVQDGRDQGERRKKINHVQTTLWLPGKPLQDFSILPTNLNLKWCQWIHWFYLKDSK
jgi:hypothetical protein